MSKSTKRTRVEDSSDSEPENETVNFDDMSVNQLKEALRNSQLRTNQAEKKMRKVMGNITNTSEEENNKSRRNDDSDSDNNHDKGSEGGGSEGSDDSDGDSDEDRTDIIADVKTLASFSLGCLLVHLFAHDLEISRVDFRRLSSPHPDRTTAALTLINIP
ncbi:hypothetical protein R3P38DRAFT_3185239 [Favolaschia claudopus]|uniref:Uncharacterized protein n=1 Tax=Favolaschia claudopus TaxID=2862362 RepID=A0AAW0C6Z6_9AGAR